jgi:hypothetical protein
MSKEEYYSKIKRFVYKRFNELEVFESTDGKVLYFIYKNNEYAQIRINKKLGEVYYHYEFKDKICKLIRLKQVDFEILLSIWVEDTFQIKVNHTPWLVQLSVEPLLKIPTK